MLKIHAAPITKRGDIDYESIVKVRPWSGVLSLFWVGVGCMRQCQCVRDSPPPTPESPPTHQPTDPHPPNPPSIPKTKPIPPQLTDGFNCADLRNVCTEAGLFAIRAGRDYVLEEDFMKAARKVLYILYYIVLYYIVYTAFYHSDTRPPL